MRIGALAMPTCSHHRRHTIVYNNRNILRRIIQSISQSNIFMKHHTPNYYGSVRCQRSY